MAPVIYNSTAYPVASSGVIIGGGEWQYVDHDSPLLDATERGITTVNVPESDEVSEEAAEAVTAFRKSQNKAEESSISSRKATKQKSKSMGDTEKDTPSTSESEA